MEATRELKQAVTDYRGGRQEAFTPLYEESSRYIYTCIYGVMRGNENLQDVIGDIMQDTYVEISRSIAQLGNEDSFLFWAKKIAIRKCYAWLKKNKKYVLLQEEDNTFENLADDEDIIPEEVMQNKEKQRLVRTIIETQLTPMQKVCIVSYYYNEQKQSEIAQELGIPENTVKTNLSRAKAKIRDGVLDLEKKQGTKLYSVMPLLLLLFKEDVEACSVPYGITEAVKNAVYAAGVQGAASAAGLQGAASTASAELQGAASMAGAQGAGVGETILEKIAGASIKAKIAAGIVTVGVLGTIAGSVYTAGKPEEQPLFMESTEGMPENDTNEPGTIQSDTEQGSEPEADIITRLQGDTWERYYARVLLSPETRCTGFDLHDFDEDGIPELVTEEKDGLLYIKSFHDIVSIPGLALTADFVGYGETASELICIYPRTTDDGIDMTSVFAYDNFELVETIETSGIIMMDNYTYDVTDKDYNMETVSYEEGLQKIQAWQEKFHKIDFKPLDQDTVIGFIEANSPNGSLLDD